MSAIDAGKYATRKTPQKRPPPEPSPDPRRWIGGIPQPTDLEIAEGRAYRLHLLEPDDECLLDAHMTAWNRLMFEQRGSVGLIRCGLCHVTKWGRMLTDTCTVCKSRAAYYG